MEAEGEESKRALEQVEHERKHGGPGQERALDPNARKSWIESAKAERDEIAQAGEHAAQKAQEAAEQASGSARIAEMVRADIDKGFASARNKEKLDTEDRAFSGTIKGEMGLDTVQKRGDLAIHEELRVPGALGDKHNAVGACMTTKDTNYPST